MNYAFFSLLGSGFLLTVLFMELSVQPLQAQSRARKHLYSVSDDHWAGAASTSPPVWSRDGEEVIFQYTREEGIAQIWAAQRDGSKLRRLTQGNYRAGHPSTCSQDDRLAFVSDKSGARQIYVQHPDGKVEQLTTGSPDKSWPVFSPDCSQVVFVQVRNLEAGHNDLHVLDVESRVVRSLLDDVRYLGWSSWSADGQWVFFYREISGFPNQIWRIRPDGTGAQALTHGDHGDYWYLTMALRTNLLAFAHNPRHQLQWGNNADLWLINLDTDTCRPLTSAPWHEHAQSLSPDGLHLAYWDNRSGDIEVYVMNFETGQRQAITEQRPDEITQWARRDGAEAALQVLQADPTVPISGAALTQYLAEQAQQAASPLVELAQRAREALPESQALRQAYARELFRAGAFAKARAQYEVLHQLEPYAADVAGRLSALYLLEHYAGTPLQNLEQAPLSEAVVNRLGYVLLRQERFAEAVDVLRWNTAFYPSSLNAYDSLGEALYWARAYEAAQRMYEQVLDLDPGNANALRFLERIAQRANQPPPAPIACPLVSLEE